VEVIFPLSSTWYIHKFPHAFQLRLTLSPQGALSAYFRAHADFLINYSPFHFVGDIGVSVGVEFTLDLWICTIHISVDIGAAVHLTGPPFGGYVYVDFWVFGFTVHFGDSGDTDNAIDLPAFWQLLLQQPGDTPPATLSAISEGTTASASPTNAHVLVVETGRPPGNSKTKSIATKEGAIWVVRPQGFTFRVQSRFAIGTASCNGHSEIVSPTSIYAKPMHLTASTGNDDQAIQSTLSIKVDFEESLGVFTCNPIMKKVPKALWGACESILLGIVFYADEQQTRRTRTPRLVATALTPYFRTMTALLSIL
jgi:hypothetical protein